MTDETTDPAASGQLCTLEGAADLVAAAIDHGVAAGDPTFIGDHGFAYVVPNGYKVETLDLRQFEDEPRLPTFITGKQSFIGVGSIADYAGRHIGPGSVSYVTDPFGKGQSLLTSDTDIARIVLDDHPTTPALPADPPDIGRCAHKAVLVLRPTAAARRWGAALAATALTQEQFLDLVVDGLTEIASPDGAVLRDLISDLHAIRSTEVKSVIRTGGEGAIQLAENVKLHAGPGDTVSFPESMTLHFQPFAGEDDTITIQVRIKPTVRTNDVVFALSCALLDDALNVVIQAIAADLATSTGLPTHWVP